MVGGLTTVGGSLSSPCLGVWVPLWAVLLFISDDDMRSRPGGSLSSPCLGVNGRGSLIQVRRGQAGGAGVTFTLLMDSPPPFVHGLLCGSVATPRQLPWPPVDFLGALSPVMSWDGSRASPVLCG